MPYTGSKSILDVYCRKPRLICPVFVFTAKSKVDLPKTVAEYLSKEKKTKMDRLIRNGNFSVKFIDYDWSTHDKVNAKKYKKGDLYSYTVFGLRMGSTEFESLLKLVSSSSK